MHMLSSAHTHTHSCTRMHLNIHVSGSSSPTTVTSNVMQSPSSAGTAASPQQTAAQQLVNVPNLTSITQLPSLVYPLTMPTVLTAQSNSVSGSGEAKKLSGELALSLSLSHLLLSPPSSSIFT